MLTDFSAYGSAYTPLQAVPSFAQLPIGDSEDSKGSDDEKRASLTPTRSNDDDGGLRMRSVKSQVKGRVRSPSMVDPVAPNSHRARRATGPQHYDAEGKHYQSTCC